MWSSLSQSLKELKFMLDVVLLLVAIRGPAIDGRSSFPRSCVGVNANRAC
jgi:hypothetical protein